uniref:Uncharacterized protein n=1 Tax=Avena sativa TaxID=4498 RepID=A0ACD6AD35_AVESA
MSATRSELQIMVPQLQDPGDDLYQVSLLRQRVSTREPFAAGSFILEANAYSAAPGDLVDGHGDLGRDLGDGNGKAWYFCSRAEYYKTAGSRRRKRKVGGGAGETCWNVERGVSILGPDKKSVAHKRTLSYVEKIKNPPGSPKPFRNKSLGWIMVEIELEQQEDVGPDQQLVLCKIYESPGPPRTGDNMPCTPAPAASAEASTSSSAACDDRRQVTTESKTSLDHNLRFPVAAQSRKPSPSCFKPGTHLRRAMLGGETTSGIAIVKKGSITAAALAVPPVVMKFGGSSMKSADHMKEMAKLVFSSPVGGGNLVAVLSAAGNTTTNLLVAAGKALSCRAKEASEICELVITKEMHFRLIDGLGLDRSIVSGSLDELERVFMGIAVMKELTSKTRDYLVSFGENVSTRIFLAYLNIIGKGTCQEWESYAVNTFGRGGANLTATTIAKEMGAREIQVWKDVDGVLTCDPTVCVNARPLPYLTFDEAVELGLFGRQSRQLAVEGGISIKVKNLYNPHVPGTVITETRDMSKSELTSIVLRSNITVLNIESTRMVDQSVFLAMSFSIFGNVGISVECVTISEGKISLIVVPPKLSSRELFQLELDNVVEELKKNSVVDRLKDRSVISLVGNAQMSAIILVKALNILLSTNVEVQKFSQGSSKVMNISFVVDNNKGEDCARALHSEFFEKGFVPEVQGVDPELNGYPGQAPESSQAAAARSGNKRKAEDHHPEAPPSVRQEQADTGPDGTDETEPQLFSNNDPTAIGGDPHPPDGALDDFYHSILNNTGIEPVRVDVVTDLTEQANNIALSDIQRLLFHEEEEDTTLVADNTDKDPDREWAHLLAQPEPQVLEEAAEGDNGLGALLEAFSPDELLGPSDEDMPCPAPPVFVPS